MGSIESKRQSGDIELKLGDLVLIWIPKTRRKKHANRWEGPYSVDQVLSKVRVKVNGREEHIHNLKRYVSNSTAADLGCKTGLVTGSTGPSSGEQQAVRPRRRAAIEALDGFTSGKCCQQNMLSLVLIPELEIVDLQKDCPFYQGIRSQS